MDMDNPAMALLFVFSFLLIPVLLAAGPFLFVYLLSVLSARTEDPDYAAPLPSYAPPEPAHSAAAAGASGTVTRVVWTPDIQTAGYFPLYAVTSQPAARDAGG
jgi:hypothetical protein